MRGGEKVLLSLCRLFPQAPIFTLLHVKGSVDPEIEARDIRTTFVNRLPDVEALYRQYLPLFPAAAAAIDLTGFDLVVSSSHCVAKGVRPAPSALHVTYCHTPMRYVWDRYDDYFGEGRLTGPAKHVVPLIAAGLRAWDVATAGRVHRFVANSAFVAGRIRRFYGREAEVIPPPADVEFYTPGADRPGAFDLVVSALAPYKRLELVLEAYRGTGRPLTIVGTGPEEARLRALAPPEAAFVGRVDDERLRDLYRTCRAVLMPGVEDFGIVPLEAMACGRPAVVFGEGGGMETVTDGRTGLVFREPTAASLRAAIDRLETVGFNRESLRSQAEAHGPAVFSSRFRGFVERALDEHNRTLNTAGDGGGPAHAREPARAGTGGAGS
jgi:glycosyltransferase involved in cell wall biosynthesis